MNKTIISLAALGSAVVLALAGCSSNKSANQAESAQQQNVSKNLVNNQPIPAFNYSQMRQNLIEVETAEATGVETTSFFFNLGVADPVFSCPSIGVPIPNTASLSNPNQIINDNVIAQMDPNGVYAPQASQGTFVICVNAQGKPYAHYWEGYVGAVFAPAVWNKVTHSVDLVGPPSFNFTKSK